jgi:hypothetical protein
MAYINHTQQQNKRPLTARELGGPEEGDIEMFNGEDPTAAFSHAFGDALDRNVASYKKNPVMTRRNIDALEDARSEGFIEGDPMARRGRDAERESKLAIAEANNSAKLGVAGIGADARRYEADARRDVGSGNAAARVGSSRVQGLMRQLETLRENRSKLDPGTPEVPGSGMRGFLGFGTPHKAAVPADPKIGYIDSNVKALESQLDSEPQEFGWDEVEQYARESGDTPENVQKMLEARGHAVYR